MYQDLIRAELNEAADTLNKFLSEDANICLLYTSPSPRDS